MKCCECASRLEFYLDWLSSRRISFIQLKEFHLRYMEHISDHVSRKRFNARIEIANVRIVEAAGSLNLIFCV